MIPKKNGSNNNQLFSSCFHAVTQCNTNTNNWRFNNKRLGIFFVGFLVLYGLINLVIFPKQQGGSKLPSGVQSISGVPDDEFYEDYVGHNKKKKRKKKEKKSLRQHVGTDDDDICFHYDGILLISFADEDGFATVFFLFILNQLLYAEQHNLLPWIHLDGPSSKHVFDSQEHTYPDNPLELDVYVLNGVEWDTYKDPTNGQVYQYPGNPILDYRNPNSETKRFLVEGTGIWSSYFDPPSKLDPIRHLAYPALSGEASSSATSCHKKPIFQLSLKQIEPFLMVYCPYCVRAWRRKSTPPGLAQWNLPYQQWFDPMRRTAHDVVEKHYHPTEEMIKLAHRANPVVESEEACLALHIRHSDKADRRKILGLDQFRPYVEAYIQASLWIGTTIVIYVSTDSNQVLQDIQSTWPNTITAYVRFQGSDNNNDEASTKPVLRSDNTTAVFQLSQDHHRTNTEVLVDILAMARCEFMVHGMSAVTEATHYLNLRLHNQSVNLEEEVVGMNYLHSTKPTMDADSFGKMVRNRLQEKRKASEAQHNKIQQP